jgi:hypothetical protein
MTNRTALFSRKQPGGVYTISDLVAHPGDIWFVDSGASGSGDTVGHGRDPDSPFLTLDYAIGQCTANQGDVIYVLPGHAETFIATNGFDADVAGIAIIGLGWGADRPTFTFNHAAAQVNVGAASVRIENLRFVTSITAVVAAVQVEGVADSVFKNCEWYWGGTTGDDFIISLELEAGAHRTLVEGCRFLAEPAVAGAAVAIKLTGASDNVVIRDCEFMGDYSTACVNGITNLSQGLMFLDNLVHNTDAGEPYLEVLTGTTGVIANTRGLASGATVAANAVADAMAHCENFVVNTAGTIAIIKGAGGSPALDAD